MPLLLVNVVVVPHLLVYFLYTAHNCMTSPFFQVEVVTKAPPSGGSAVEIHRYMAAGSCIGVEVWQPSGLFGEPLEAELTSLVCDSLTLSMKCPASEI